MDGHDSLPKLPANYVPLSPISFLARAARIYPQRVAVIHGARRFTYAQMMERCRRLASALGRAGIAPGDTVAVLAPNIPEMLEAHYGVPMAGAVLNALNIRLDAEAIARASVRDLQGVKVRLPTPEDLIVYKAVSHRDQDLQDIYNIIQANPGLDVARVRFWAAQFAETLGMPELWEDIARWL